MTVSILIFSAPKMSSFIRVGDMLGGDETIPLNLIRSVDIAIRVISNIPIIIALEFF